MSKLLIMICACCSLGLSPLAAQDSTEYDNETFYEPVDPTPQEDPKPKTNKPPMLGVQMTPPPTHAQEVNGTTPDEGVYVRRVFPNTAAENMGVQPGDIILTMDGTEINSMSTLREIVFNSSVGDDVEVTVIRNGEQHNLSGTYRPWLEDVKRGKLDDKAEQRYREMQKRRLEKKMAGNNNLNNTLSRNIAARKAPVDYNNWQNLDNAGIDTLIQKELGALPSYKLPTIDLSGLPFSFSFSVDVNSNELSASDNDAGKPLDIAKPLLLLSSIAPTIDLAFSVDIDTNVY